MISNAAIEIRIVNGLSFDPSVGGGTLTVTITDGQGNAICLSSAGALGFKGSRKSTPYAAQIAAEDDVQVGL